MNKDRKIKQKQQQNLGTKIEKSNFKKTRKFHKNTRVGCLKNPIQIDIIEELEHDYTLYCNNTSAKRSNDYTDSPRVKIIRSTRVQKRYRN